jgi:hypothetical protein
MGRESCIFGRGKVRMYWKGGEYGARKLHIREGEELECIGKKPEGGYWMAIDNISIV